MKAMTTTQTGSKTSKMVLGAINCALMVAASTPSIADVSARKPADPKNQFTKLVGNITQLDGEKSRLTGNAFVIGKKGCFILTSYHVAFGKSIDSDGFINMVDDENIGHKVNFAYNLDPKSGRFQQKIKAAVVGFGDYGHDTNRGLIGDIAILRLENCLGKGFSNLELDRPAADKRIPTGRLMTVSATTNDRNGKVEMLVEEGCRSLPATPAQGMILSTCETPPGASGSMLLEEGQDGKWRLVGLNTGQITLSDGSTVAQSVFATAINELVDPVLSGEAPTTATPFPDQRKP